MKKSIFLVFLLVMVAISNSQSVNTKIESVYKVFESDAQLKHAAASLYVIDAKTGAVVFSKNELMGLAPASTQKIITSITALELLGKDYRYNTFFKVVNGKLYVKGSYDPTLGSWRYSATKDSAVFSSLISGLGKKGVKNIREIHVLNNDLDKILPDGWINQDVGNYYGAGPQEFNWHENQVDLSFIPGAKIGDPAKIDVVASPQFATRTLNEVKTAKAGSGDNAYIYFLPADGMTLVKGTIPMGSSRFKISGADRTPYCSFSLELAKYAASQKFYTGSKKDCDMRVSTIADSLVIQSPDYVHASPPMDSIIYWFNKRSINLYGESLLRAIALEKTGMNSPDSGLSTLRNFWKEKGVNENELNMYDGSGLSPLNRVTTHSQVEILKYAKGRDWYGSFYDALPEFNNMKMKSGTISDVKGFCGYHTGKDGKEYIFSFIVNNYSGRSSELVAKMYKVLDILKE